jgi:hypothetical protein
MPANHKDRSSRKSILPSRHRRPVVLGLNPRRNPSICQLERNTRKGADPSGSGAEYARDAERRAEKRSVSLHTGEGTARCEAARAPAFEPETHNVNSPTARSAMTHAVVAGCPAAGQSEALHSWVAGH